MKDTAIELPLSIKKLGNITDPGYCRYALDCVQVERMYDKTAFIASDGSTMSVVFDTSEDTKNRCMMNAGGMTSQLLHRDDIKKKIPTGKYNKNYLDSDTFEISTVKPGNEASSSKATEGEGRFPRWTEVFKSNGETYLVDQKKKPEWTSCKLNVGRLKKILDIYQAENIDCVEVRILDDVTQAEFTGKSKDGTRTVACVLMCMTVD